MEEEIVTGMDWCLVSARSFLCQQQRPHPLQSVTAHRLQMPCRWFPLLESLFLLLLVKLLQL
ncbi:uncharacterized protein DMAD_03434 [Drosophila madeirensis]|uniref:Uncharacterized protein n=1 Tax=Drosophila madeirensis TaxID=30013 RepID=A0AAU9GA26_DROMD